MSEHRTFPKPVPQLTARIERDRAIDQAWEACKRRVDARDGYSCRVCHRRVVKTLTLCTERLERHHLESRALVPALALDSRNVIVVCAACHGRLTRHEIEPSGRERFITQDGSFLNADSPMLTFLDSTGHPSMTD